VSLTSIMKGGFSKVLVENIPIPRKLFNASKDCIACPRTKNYSLIGTAFDYLFRSELKRVNPGALENQIIGEISIKKIEYYIKSNGYFQARNARITDKELNSMKDVAKKYKGERSAFLMSGILSDSFIEATIRFARLDVIFRAGLYEDVEKDVESLDIEDMRALYNLVPEGLKKSTDQILLDAEFGEASLKVGGADVDLIIGDIMVDIKTTKEVKLDEYFWSQIVGYLILADEAHKNEGILPIIENLGLYFSRYGYLWKIKANYVRENSNYEKVKKKLLDTGS